MSKARKYSTDVEIISITTIQYVMAGFTGWTYAPEESQKTVDLHVFKQGALGISLEFDLDDQNKVTLEITSREKQTKNIQIEAMQSQVSLRTHLFEFLRDFYRDQRTYHADQKTGYNYHLLEMSKGMMR